jgi:hypothetical protein
MTVESKDMSLQLGKLVLLPWKLPVPSTSFVEGPTFQAGGTSILRWTYEGDSEFVTVPVPVIIVQSLSFRGVVAFRCTYGVLCNMDVMALAYDKLVDLGETEWLASLITSSRGTHFGGGESLKHVAIFFDGGPCYEFVCEQVLLSEGSIPIPKP